MKKKLLKYVVFSLFLAQFNFVLAGAMIAAPGLAAVSDGQSVLLSWQTTSETNVSYFAVERKYVDGEFAELTRIEPRDDKNYEWRDATAYKTENAAVYVYRLRIVDTDGNESISSEASVYHNVSSVRRTWGSIKAIFR